MTDFHQNRKCYIITGGDCGNISGISGSEYIIACDKGLQYALKSSLVPDIIIGDFDSIDGSVDLSLFENVVRYPKEKDDTDTLLAIKHALSEGFRTIEIYGAFGGRMDHFIANIQACAYAADRGALCLLRSDDELAYVFRDASVEIEKAEGFSFSMFSLSDRCLGVSVTDMKYPADGIALENTFPVGISNEFLGERTIVSVESGILMVMQSRMR